MQTIEIFSKNNNLITFKEGWDSEIEGEASSPHRWSIGIETTIVVPKFYITESQLGIMVIELDAIPYLSKNGSMFQDVLLFMDSSLLTAIRLYDADPKKVTTQVYLNRHDKPYSLLKFLLPNSMTPSMCGDGADERQLGIGLKSLKLTLS